MATLERYSTTNFNDPSPYEEFADFFPEREEDFIEPKFNALPKNLNYLYCEVVFTINHGQFILASAGLRALLEGICDDKKLGGEVLQVKIRNLKEVGIPEDVIDNLHSLRFLGNDAVHDLSSADLDDLKQGVLVTEKILYFLYKLQYELQYESNRLTKPSHYLRLVNEIKATIKNKASSSGDEKIESLRKAEKHLEKMLIQTREKKLVAKAYADLAQFVWDNLTGDRYTLAMEYLVKVFDLGDHDLAEEKAFSLQIPWREVLEAWKKKKRAHYLNEVERIIEIIKTGNLSQEKKLESLQQANRHLQNMALWDSEHQLAAEKYAYLAQVIVEHLSSEHTLVLTYLVEIIELGKDELAKKTANSLQIEWQEVLDWKDKLRAELLASEPPW